MPPKGADEVSRIPKPVPLVRQAQAQKWSRTRSNFPQTQGPVARWEFRPATQILRAGNILPGPRGNPRNGGSRGRAAWRREALPNRRLRPPPGAFLVTFWASKKSLAAGAAKLPCKERNFSIIAPSSVTASPCHLPPKGKAFKGSPLIRPLRGHLPPRGKALRGRPPDHLSRRAKPCKK